MKLSISVALIALLAACSPQGGNDDGGRKDRRERRADREGGSGPDRKGDARTGKKARIAQADANGDGEITVTEFPGKKRRFDRMDTNGDGKLSGSELQ